MDEIAIARLLGELFPRDELERCGWRGSARQASSVVFDRKIESFAGDLFPGDEIKSIKRHPAYSDEVGHDVFTVMKRPGMDALCVSAPDYSGKRHYIGLEKVDGAWQLSTCPELNPFERGGPTGVHLHRCEQKELDFADRHKPQPILCPPALLKDIQRMMRGNTARFNGAAGTSGYQFFEPSKVALRRPVPTISRGI